MDITSADVASNNRMITAVLRVKNLSAMSPNAPTGMSWRVSFTAGRFTFTLASHASATGSTTFDAAYSSVTGGALYGGGATGVFDTAKNEVRITARLSLLSAQTDIKPGTVMRGVTGETAQEILAPGGPGGATLYSVRRSVDVTSGDHHYVAGAKSCVAVGK